MALREYNDSKSNFFDSTQKNTNMDSNPSFITDNNAAIYQTPQPKSNKLKTVR